jgi:hypothetical protein
MPTREVSAGPRAKQERSETVRAGSAAEQDAKRCGAPDSPVPREGKSGCLFDEIPTSSNRSNDQPRMAELGRLAMDGVMSVRTARPDEELRRGTLKGTMQLRPLFFAVASEAMSRIATRVHNTVANARTLTSGLVRERSRIAQRCGGNGCGSVAVGAEGERRREAEPARQFSSSESRL